MRVRQGRFRSRVARAIGVETKWSDFAYAGVNLPDYATSSGGSGSFKLNPVVAQGVDSYQHIIGQNLFLRDIQIFYIIVPGLVAEPAAVQQEPLRVRLALVRSDNPVNLAPTDVWQSGAGTVSEGIINLWPRRILDAGAQASNTSVRNIQVLKQWSHYVNPYASDVSISNVDFSGRSKFYVRKRFVVNVDQRSALAGPSTSSGTLLQPCYWLMAYAETSSFDPSSPRPYFQLSVRCRYYDT